NAVVMFGFSNGENAQTLATPTVYRCTIENSSTGISVVNCDQLVLKENTINHCNLGIYLNMVNSAYISSNTILGWQSATGSPMPGISMCNGGGYLRNNTIRYHNYGVELVYSSPDMGVNTIENNYKCGLYISSGSYPNLVQQLANPQCWYPIGGCNVIRNNGTFTYLPPSTPVISPDGAEIFLNTGDVLLSYGYNEISDDRTGIPEYLTLPLIKGTRSREGTREFFVDRNYWGTVGASSLRFGTLQVIYNPTADYCPLPDAPCSGSELIIQTTDGQIIDTLDSRARESTEISALEETYSTADKLYYNGAVEESKTYYQMIVEGNYTNEEKLYAYNKLYEIGNLLKEDDNYFSALQNAFNSIIAVETDTLLLKAFNQKSILCDVSKQEYLTAISKFDNIIQQNPNSEEAVYAEIDIMTTALKIDTTNTSLGKIAGGKYLVKGTSDYLSKLNNLLQNKFGINTEDKEQIIPKEYSLYQNYPNPFNPTTTIKFDIPASLNPSQGGTLRNVTLKVYDILGREVVILVDEPKNEGRYEVIFNASSLASGVYVYKLQAGDFISSKKMLLIK
ncbi:MAG TPA: NosD domain-containing protein, partial [Ignavibacteriaceae bacterium]|nr:NosD domain-containing protein [Ignavibacteriaceae bacterium]